ncbi:MAG TPA: hypothetical protein VFW07_20920 [Parafilimonas sp.]|nr:hypothetical protein [Parafilimonas sp.]
MKKIFAVILCIVYGVASSGATVNFHYCMGKFTGWDINADALHKCSNCGMEKEKKKGCCNDEQATIRLKRNQLASTINDVPCNQFFYIQHHYPFLRQPVLTSDKDVFQSLHKPPLIRNLSPLILHCVFRI